MSDCNNTTIRYSLFNTIATVYSFTSWDNNSRFDILKANEKKVPNKADQRSLRLENVL